MDSELLRKFLATTGFPMQEIAIYDESGENARASGIELPDVAAARAEAVKASGRFSQTWTAISGKAARLGS